MSVAHFVMGFRLPHAKFPLVQARQVADPDTSQRLVLGEDVEGELLVLERVIEASRDAAVGAHHDDGGLGLGGTHIPPCTLR